MTAGEHDAFNDAISLVVECENQKELDRYWNAILENGGKPTAGGWINDRWGVRWQIVPRALGELMADKDPKRPKRVSDAMMKMAKLDVATLQQAAQG